MAFLALTLAAVFVFRGNAERFCPFGGVEALYAYVTEGNTLCSIGVSNFFVLGGVLLSVLLLRRAFCGYACPIGAIQEGTRAVAAKLGIPALTVSRGVDRWLSLLKYAVLALILFVTWRAGELLFRAADPCYALLSRHGEDITVWAYVVSGAILVGAFLVHVPFCRWLCPLAAVMNPFSRAAVGRVARDGASCVDCARCAKACPMAIEVHRKQQVDEARCTACLRCVDACPKRSTGTLAFRLPPLAPRLSRGALVGLFLAILASAVIASELFPLPSFTWARGVEPAQTATVEMQVEELTCRGRANMLRYFLDRDDDLALLGYVKAEAWPGPGAARLRVTYDPAQDDERAVRDAILEPYYDYDLGTWRPSPFSIPGYDPLGP